MLSLSPSALLPYEGATAAVVGAGATLSALDDVVEDLEGTDRKQRRGATGNEAAPASPSTTRVTGRPPWTADTQEKMVACI